jgi:glyoxylate reductase
LGVDHSALAPVSATRATRAFAVAQAAGAWTAKGNRVYPFHLGDINMECSTCSARACRARPWALWVLGAIGVAVARRARAFGMNVIYQSLFELSSEAAVELGAGRVLELDELLATADVVSLHCPYTPETHHLIGAAQFAAMRETAYLVNTARGPIVDEAALVDALRDGQIAGAGLDVYEREPLVHPGLLELENVALLPHLGSATIETRTAMATLAAGNALAVLRGEHPPTPIQS